MIAIDPVEIKLNVIAVKWYHSKTVRKVNYCITALTGTSSVTPD